MSDFEETHGEMAIHTPGNHPWDITYTYGKYMEDEAYFIYFGSEKGVQVEMQRIFEDNYDGAPIDYEGHLPSDPVLVAYCEQCDLSVLHIPTDNFGRMKL